MTSNKTSKHPGVSPPPTTTTTTRGLFKRGNYSLLHLLMIVNAAGSKGIPTRKLLDEIGSHATFTQRVIDRAYKEGYINRKHGEPSAPGQFAPYINTLTEKGRQQLLLLQSQLSLSL